MKKNLGPILLLCLFSFCLVGCWDYTEIELVNFVFGVGIDQIEPDFVLVTEIIKSTGAGQEAEFKTVEISTKGLSLAGTAHALVNPAGMTLFWAHAQVFIISEEVARGGIIPALDFAVRGRDLRTSILFFVAKDCTVEEIFQSKPLFTDSVSAQLVNVVKFHPQLPIFYPQEMWQFNKEMIKSGISGSLPTVQLVHEEGELVPIVKGTALFKLDRMVGWLDGEESQIFSLLKGLDHRGRFVMDTVIDKQEAPVTYRIMGNQVEIKPVMDGDKLTMKINMRLQLSVSEISSAELDFYQDEVIAKMQSQVAAAFKRRTDELLWKIQEEYNTDVLGFGLLLKRKHPDWWRDHAEGWDDDLRNLNVNVHVECEITKSGVTSESIVVRH